MKSLLPLLLLSQLCLAYEISSLKVTGEKDAQLQFVGTKGKSESISMRTVGNTIELQFPGATLAESVHGKIDVESPHALIHRASLFETGDKVVKGIVVLNGTTENLKNRVQMQDSTEGLRLKVDFPKGENAALNLLKEEQLPLKEAVQEKKKEVASFQWVQLLMAAIVFVAAGFATFFMVRFMRAKGNWKGSRKFLVEQLSFVPIGGTKTGVSLLKVGGEFVLVGVTPNQVTLLSTLPKLQEQYDEESKYDRGAFNEAIQEELKRKPFNA